MSEFWDGVANLPPTPTRRTAQGDVDTWNEKMRQSPVYLNFMRRYGLPTDGRVKLSSAQQASLERELAAAGMPVPNGMHIDQGGNLNQKNRLGRNAAITAGVAAAALTGAGIAGVGPMSGLFGGSAAAGAGAGAGGAGLGLGPVGTGSILPGMGMVAPAGYAGATAAGATGLGLGIEGVTGPATYFGELMGPMAAENTLFGAPQALSMILPGAHNVDIASLFENAGAGDMFRKAVGAAQKGDGGAMDWLKKAGKFLLKDSVWPSVLDTGLEMAQAKMMADAARDAARMQAESAEKALAFEKERYGDAKANFTPYVNAGHQGLTQLSSLMQTPRDYSDQMASVAQRPSQVSQTVMMRAPTGETKAVPAGLVPHLQARGAEVIQ